MNKKIVDKEKELDELCINTIRFLSIDAVQKADSGHPGLPLGAAPMAYVLWTRFLKHNPTNPGWFNRDRFVLSAGHGSMLLYSLLYLAGYQLPLSQIKQFRQWGSITPGHPERELTPGVEVTTGPLGQGFANGVGMAIAEANLAARYNRPDYEVFDHYTYGLVSDGDLMEGVSAEAASLAGHLKLGKLIYLYDNNHISLSGATDITYTEKIGKRFEAYGWHVQTVEDGNDVKAIAQAIQNAQHAGSQPSLIIVNTHIGYGSPHMQDTYEAHGKPLGEEEVKLTKQNLGWPVEPLFYVPERVKNVFREAVDRGKEAETQWIADFKAYARRYPAQANELETMINERLPESWAEDVPVFKTDMQKGISTRVASSQVLNALAGRIPGLFGGDADLNPSTKTLLNNLGDFESKQQDIPDTQGSAKGGLNYQGRNIHFGVREHAMGSILNGIAAHGGFIPFGSTFLVFSDYMRPPMRLAALSKLHVIFVFTHDSIALGEDGPTHQPVEQLVGLRTIPNLTVIRPADANEVSVAWQVAIEAKDHPVVLVFTRQNVPVLDRTQFNAAEGLRQGGYILADAPDHDPELILIASGSEVSLAVKAWQKLTAENIRVRLISMPSWELFDAQPEAYRRQVLPPEVKSRIAIEAGSPRGWRDYVGDEGEIIGIDKFGSSAPGEKVLDEYGFSIDNILQHARALMKSHSEKIRL